MTSREAMERVAAQRMTPRSATGAGLQLPDTEGERMRSRTARFPATVVVFTCNHCPYALAWHDRIAAAASDYAGRGVRFLAINPNDAEPVSAGLVRGDAASASATRTGRCRTSTTRARRSRAHYGAKVTPDVFVLDADGPLRYRGAPDADYARPRPRTPPGCAAALDAVLSGRASRPGRRPSRLGAASSGSGRRAVPAPRPSAPRAGSGPARCGARPGSPRRVDARYGRPT